MKKNYYFALHMVILIWGFTAILGKLIKVPSLELVLYRTSLSSIILFFVVLLFQKKWDIKNNSFIPPLITGILIAIHWFLFFYSAKIANISICLIGIATSSLWTSLFETIYFRKKIQYNEMILGLTGVVGMSILFKTQFTMWIGFVMAILSAIFGAIFTIINAQFIKKGHNFYVVSFYELLGATLTILIFLPYYSYLNNGINMSLDFQDLLWLAILTCVCTVFAYTLSIKLMKEISPFVMNLTLNLEPVYGIILAVIIFGETEKMNIQFYLGASIILIAVFVEPLFKLFHKKIF